MDTRNLYNNMDRTTRFLICVMGPLWGEWGGRGKFAQTAPSIRRAFVCPLAVVAAPPGLVLCFSWCACCLFLRLLPGWFILFHVPPAALVRIISRCPRLDELSPFYIRKSKPSKPIYATKPALPPEPRPSAHSSHPLISPHDLPSPPLLPAPRPAPTRLPPPP